MSKAVKARKPMSSRSKGAICLILLLALTVFVSCLAIVGMKLDAEGVQVLLPWVPVNSENWPKSLPLSRTLGGGEYAEYTAALPEGAEGLTLDAQMKEAAKIMKERLDGKGLTDAAVTVKNENTLRVELPATEELSAVLSMISAPGYFEFKDADGNTFMTSEHIKQAGVGSADNAGTTYYVVYLETTDEGKQLLADATSAHIGEALSVYRDGVLLSAPTVSEAFTTGQISVPLGLELDATINAALQLRSGAYQLNLTLQDSGALAATSGAATLKVVLIAVLALLVLALVYLVITGKLTGVSGIWTVWCAILLEMFFFATIVLTTLTVALLIALLLGILLAIFTAVTRTDAISKQIAEGAAPKAATKLGLRTAGKLVWLVHGALLALSLILMIFSFSKLFGYTLCAGVVASAIASPLMRAFQACFTSISKKPALFGKGK